MTDVKTLTVKSPLMMRPLYGSSHHYRLNLVRQRNRSIRCRHRAGQVHSLLKFIGVCFIEQEAARVHDGDAVLG
jgi:hypothetical protein